MSITAPCAHLVHCGLCGGELPTGSGTSPDITIAVVVHTAICHPHANITDVADGLVRTGAGR